MKGLSSNGIGRDFLNEETAVEDSERQVYRVESIQPCGHGFDAWRQEAQGL